MPDGTSFGSLISGFAHFVPHYKGGPLWNDLSQVKSDILSRVPTSIYIVSKYIRFSYHLLDLDLISLTDNKKTLNLDPLSSYLYPHDPIQFYADITSFLLPIYVVLSYQVRLI